MAPRAEYYVVHTSDGVVHEFDNVDDYVACLDEYGPEVVSSTEDDGEEYMMADDPRVTGPSNVYYSTGPDDYYDDHPPEGME